MTAKINTVFKHEKSAASEYTPDCGTFSVFNCIYSRFHMLR